MRKIFLFSIVILLFININSIYSQEDYEHETAAEVKELETFHKTIFQLWHKGWPNKDYELLKSLLPDVEAGYEALQEAELPGILRDKKPKWEGNLAKFGEYVDDYKKAVESNNDQALLNAAENIHSQFEELVRTIRPVLKEVDEFHQVLYVLYHYHTPDYDYEKIKESVVELITKMEILNQAELPKRLESKKDKFVNARKNLEKSVKNLSEVVNTGDDKGKIIAAVETMHSKYQKLEVVFD